MGFAKDYLWAKLGLPRNRFWWALLREQKTQYAIKAKQLGTGDPSPDNVRPILPGLRLIRDDSSTLEVYGGTLDVTNGVLTVTHRCVSFDGTENWGVVNNPDNIRYYVTVTVGDDFTIGSEVYSHTVYNPQVKISQASTDVQYGARIYKTTTAGALRMIICLPGMPGTKDDFLSMLATWATAGTPLQVCYALTEPVTYQLTPQEVERAVRELRR